MADLKGKEIALQLNERLKAEVLELTKTHRAPKLAIILVGNHPASLSYIKGKLGAAKAVGIIAELHQLDENTSQENVLKIIQALNDDHDVDGMILQLPLPDHLNERTLIDAISQNKDADGFHTINQGKLYQSLEGIVPATPLGIIKLIDEYSIDVKGMNAVIIGRSRLLRQPRLLHARQLVFDRVRPRSRSGEGTHLPGDDGGTPGMFLGRSPHRRSGPLDAAARQRARAGLNHRRARPSAHAPPGR